MKSINPIVKQALAECGAPAFFHAWRKSDAYPTLPATYVTYHEMLYRREVVADDAPYINGRYVTVSVWTSADNVDIAPIAAKVVAGMDAAGFMLQDARDLYESDTKTYHWVSDWVAYQLATEE